MIRNEIVSMDADRCSVCAVVRVVTTQLGPASICAGTLLRIGRHFALVNELCERTIDRVMSTSMSDADITAAVLSGTVKLPQR